MPESFKDKFLVKSVLYQRTGINCVVSREQLFWLITIAMISSIPENFGIFSVHYPPYFAVVIRCKSIGKIVYRFLGVRNFACKIRQLNVLATISTMVDSSIVVCLFLVELRNLCFAVT